jgi:hypothetical protein
MKKNNYIRLSLAFAQFTRYQLQSFAVLVLACLKNNALFPNLPVKYADLAALVDMYQQAMAAAAMGGYVATAELNEAYDDLIGALRQTAGYIQSLGLTSQSDALSSGFDIIVPGKHPQTPLSTPSVGLDNSVTCQLTVNIPAVTNAKAYRVQYATGAGPMLDLGIFPNTRKIVIPNTTPGTNYSARAQAIGGSTQYSSWSAVVTVMSM